MLAEFLRSVVGVGYSDGDHPAHQLNLFPEFQRLASDQLLALGADDGRTMPLTLSATQVFTSEPQPRAPRCHTASYVTRSGTSEALSSSRFEFLRFRSVWVQMQLVI